MALAVPLTACKTALLPPLVRRTQRGHTRDVEVPSVQFWLREAYTPNSDVVPLTSASPTGAIGALGSLCVREPQTISLRGFLGAL